MSRRRWLELAALASLSGAFLPWHAWAGRAGTAREYHLCLNPQAVLQDPELLALVSRAGVSCVWLAGFFYGHWPWPIETLTRAREALRLGGLEARVINVPLGHPGDSLGARDGNFPLTPPAHWRLGSNRDGRSYAGTSLHAPATAENVEALRRLRQAGFSQFFVDDDFRLARGPGRSAVASAPSIARGFCAGPVCRTAVGPSCWMTCVPAASRRSFGSGWSLPVTV